jgi:hypothetical protein
VIGSLLIMLWSYRFPLAELYVRDFVQEAAARGLIDLNVPTPNERSITSSVEAAGFTKSWYRSEFYAGSLLCDAAFPFTADRSVSLPKIHHQIKITPNGLSLLDMSEVTQHIIALLNSFRDSLKNVAVVTIVSLGVWDSNLLMERICILLSTINANYLFGAEKNGFVSR